MKPHPTTRPYISGHVKAGWLRCDQGRIIAGRDFADYSNDTIAMMIIEEVGESSLFDQERRMVTAIPASGFGKPEADLREPS